MLSPSTAKLALTAVALGVLAGAGAGSEDAARLAEEVVEQTAPAAEQRLQGRGGALLRRQPPIVHLAQAEDFGFAVAGHARADRRGTHAAQIAELGHVLILLLGPPRPGGPFGA